MTRHPEIRFYTFGVFRVDPEERLLFKEARGARRTAAEIGECVANEADAGEVLVSGTVKDLGCGFGIKFENRGIRLMPDCGEWRLFAVQRSV